ISLFDWNVLQSARPNIVRARTNKPVVSILFKNVCRPSGDPAAGKYWGEKIGRDSKRVIGRSGVEIYVCVKTLLAFHHLFHLPGHFIPLSFTGSLAKLTRHFREVDCARIYSTIHLMAEAHNLFLLCKRSFDPGLDAIHVANLQKILDHALISASVQWSLQRTDGGYHRPKHIREGSGRPW